MKSKIFLALAIVSLGAYSCVSPKKLQEAEAKYGQLNGAYADLQGKFRDAQDAITKSKSDAERAADKSKSLQSTIDELNKQVDFLKSNNNVVLSQLKDLSVVTGAQAESIKMSLDNIGAKDLYIQGLQSSMARKDSINMNLVMNLKGAIGDLNDGDINVKVDKGVVYVDISDKLLFKSGSFTITDKAKIVLGKVAKVLAAQPQIDFMVEGHTDSKQLISGGNLMEDNWDLSVKRATTIVRVLQDTYGIEPKRMTAAGRSEYIPVAENDTPDHRAANRRTRIVILPQLDQFFKLLEKK
ncbi:MAG: OmpA family protein [Bacteroidetes bacterium]|jgi:chemotaxis protein MotB|nr:OmpA family protein [Bacteroidota bacterium]